MQTTSIDLLVIGGGINGVGVAVDAAGRGLSVVLCEKDDLANHTSSASSKLIHGGLRYLEQVEFKLVHEALREREILLHKAPYLVHPLEFVLPHDKHLRPAWMIRLGLFLYDYLARRKSIKKSTHLKLRNVEEGQPLKEKFTEGFVYTDCKTDDARLVVINAIAAKEKGATVLTRTECVSLKRSDGQWTVELRDRRTHKETTIYAKAVVNAGGPWVSQVLHDVAHRETTAGVRLIKGSHFTVPKLYEGSHAYILQNPDQRIVFVIPYQHDYTLIGTTDVPFEGDPNRIDISKEEVIYLRDAVNYYFDRQINEADINWTYSGVRALYDDRSEKPQKITREYHLDVNDDNGKTPIISIFGGKLTTYRTLAEHVLKTLKPYFPRMQGSWTAEAFLPGGDLEGKTFEEFFKSVSNTYPWLPKELVRRYSESYGTLLHRVINRAQLLSDLGRNFGAGLYENEVNYLIEHEWAQTVEDIIWRRSKLGLRLSKEEIDRLKAYLTTVVQ